MEDFNVVKLPFLLSYQEKRGHFGYTGSFSLSVLIWVDSFKDIAHRMAFA
jgi:hypothetical protein